MAASRPRPSAPPAPTASISSIDDKIDDLHYYTTFIKFGIGRATYDSSQEIRNGELEREEAVRLVRRFDGEYSERFEKDNFDYLSLPEKQFPVASKMFEQPTIDRDYFDRLTDRFRSPHLWTFEGNRWRPRRTVFDQANLETFVT